MARITLTETEAVTTHGQRNNQPGGLLCQQFSPRNRAKAEGGQRGKQQVAQWAGRRNEYHVTARIPEVSRIYRNRFRPTEADENDGQRPDDVQVCQTD